MSSIILGVPCRGRSQFLADLLRTLAATRSEDSTIIVVSNGPTRVRDPGFDGIYVVYIGDVPTIGAAVNFAWYAMASPGCILAKVDNDIDPPLNWESEIQTTSAAVALSGFLNRKEEPTPFVSIGGQVMRRPHVSTAWGMPFIHGGFTWLNPATAERLGYHDERFVRSSDGDLGERVSRVPGAIAAYSAKPGYVHRLSRYTSSTEPVSMVKAMYEATDRLIKVLPVRDIAQPTIWEECLTRADAASIVRERGSLPLDLQLRARQLLWHKLEAAYKPLGYQTLVDAIFRNT